MEGEGGGVGSVAGGRGLGRVKRPWIKRQGICSIHRDRGILHHLKGGGEYGTEAVLGKCVIFACGPNLLLLSKGCAREECITTDETCSEYCARQWTACPPPPADPPAHPFHHAS